MAVKVAWAINSVGQYCHIKHVANGKACSCHCIDCGEPLIAYNSKTSSKTEYFGHEQDSVCQGESVLHKVAKSILLDFASENQSILMPGYYASSTGLDCLGNEVVSTYYELEPRIRICKAESEVRFGNIIIDSVIFEASGRQVGVEIYVTNAKTTEDKKKFTQLDFEVFEIDLSRVPWTVEATELRALLIREAKRGWVNEAYVKARCKEVSRGELPVKIKQRNSQIYGTFKFEINNLQRNSSRDRLPLKPLTSKNFTLLNGKSYFVSKGVAVSNIRNVTFNLTGDHATAESDIIVEGNYAKKQAVPVVFSMGKLYTTPKTPTLVYQLSLNDDINSFTFKSVLVGIKRWQYALNKLAKREAAVENAKFEAAIEEKNSFLFCLSSNSNEISSRLSQRYSANLNPSDTEDDGWKMPAKLWAPFFCEFILPNYRGSVCSAKAAASDTFIEECLGLSRSQQARVKRAKRVRDLLLYLYKVDVVTALDDDRFSIPSELRAFNKISMLLNSLLIPSWVEPVNLSFYKE
ncbi:hypothetical protein [Alishewanella sp. HL-SH05]|uniref:hypothetical protein n=1 Tax=Alishewanella sp. HL-SH05 TaxID=3461145 RepID=UPI0040434BE9